MSNYEDHYEQHLYLPGEGPGLLSFPASVQEKLDRARALMDQDQPQGALALLQSAGRELATANPMLFALIVGTYMGAQRLVFEERTTESNVIEEGKYVAGIRVGRTVRTTTTDRVTTRSVRFE